MRTCPRCKMDVTPELEVPPITICGACYARLPDNRGLTIEELRSKALHSRWGRKTSIKDAHEREIKRWNNLSPEEREEEHESIQEMQRYATRTAEDILAIAGKRKDPHFKH